MNYRRTIVGLSIVLLTVLVLSLYGCKKKEVQSQGNSILAGNITIIDTRTDQADRDRAKQNVEDTMIRYPDVNCMVGLWSYNRPAILSAVKDAGKLGNVKIVCFDEEEDALKAVADGYIYATVVQQPYEFGYQSVRLLAALARGDKTVVPESKVQDVPVKVIRRDNVMAFWDNLKSLLSEKDVNNIESSSDKINVAFLTNNPADFWKIARAGVRKAEKDFNVSCLFMMPPTGSSEEQQRMLESLIARKTSGIAISPVDPVNQTELINEACAKMNVITQDSDAPKSNRICYVGTNNYKAGREAGKLIRELLPNGGKIMLFVGSLDAQNAQDRRAGIIDELSGKPMAK